ncbi:hypothetical protein F4553_002205 [Allocatelliglobosispora scoriae]|uniref:Uncharacterized protein n=1 Tax=Allocatelliglobosispora scoriae TaxID=643052 RepID=A0A841BNF9_9ACTN|nr:hypothetical protein [Allocatelliglobosispora scoriae]MBB5868826.1 hypothetical protein [Allocatelliglobosispora scoriae]
MESAYRIRLCDVTSARWRSSESTEQARPSTEFDLTSQFQSFYDSFEGQLPKLLAQRLFDAGDVAMLLESGTVEQAGEFSRVEVVLFGLPFPANQIVATVVLDFPLHELTDGEESYLRKLLQACTGSRLLITGRPVTAIVDELAAEIGAVPEEGADPAEDESKGAREHHALVFVNGNGSPAPEYPVIAGILYGIQPPYQPEFIQLSRPKSLNRTGGTYAAVSPLSSFLYGQQSEAENSVLLTTVQAVGTAARFQRIWHDAYYHVQQFQAHRQSGRTGEQTREDLETLADEVGNLELDLAFSVETTANLGLGSTTARIDDFHHTLYEVMQIRSRARTVGQMFVRLGSSLKSELTAIESREKKIEDARKKVEDARQFRFALTLGLLSFFFAPLGLLFAFFGVNATQVGSDYSMFDLHHYWLVYTFVLVIMLAPTPVVLHIGVRRWRSRRQPTQPEPSTRT